MNCYVHSDRDAIGVCVSCGKPICSECKVMLKEKFYCNSCADKLFAATSLPDISKEPNWFQKHLNWTAVLSWVALYPIIFVMSFVLGIILYLIDPNTSEESVTGLAYLLAFVVTLAWLIPTGGWILKQKRRTLWHLLWLFIPIGIWVFLSLENRNEFLKGSNGSQTRWIVVVPVAIIVAGILAAIIIPNIERAISK